MERIIKICIIVSLISIISVSAFAIGETSSGNLELYDGSISYLTSSNSSSVQSINQDPMTINELWDNWYDFMVYNLGDFLETYIPNIASDSRTWLNMWRINGNQEGIYHRLFTRLVDTQSWSSMTNLYDILSAINSSNISSYVDGIETKLDSINSNLVTIFGRVYSIDTVLNGDIHSDLMGLNRMFSSANGGGHYYTLFNTLAQDVSDTADASANNATASAGIRTDLVNYLTWTDTYHNNSVLSVFKDYQGNNFLNRMDANLVDLSNYFYSFFIDDNRPNSTNGGEAIIGTYDNTTNILNSLGNTPGSSVTSIISDISASEESQIDLLNDIIDVLATDTDKDIRDDQEPNYIYINNNFLNGTSTDTSLGTSDFADLFSFLGSIRRFFKPNISIGGIGQALDDGLNAGSSFFSQAVHDELQGVTP